MPFAPRIKVTYYVVILKVVYLFIEGDWTWSVDMVFSLDMDMRGGLQTGLGQKRWLCTDWTSARLIMN